MEINFFAAARSAAGVAQLHLEVGELAGASLADLQDHLVRVLPGATPSGQTLADILPRCSFLVDGVAARGEALTDSSLLEAAQRVDVLPPFAGG